MNFFLFCIFTPPTRDISASHFPTMDVSHLYNERVRLCYHITVAQNGGILYSRSKAWRPRWASGICYSMQSRQIDGLPTLSFDVTFVCGNFKGISRSDKPPYPIFQLYGLFCIKARSLTEGCPEFIEYVIWMTQPCHSNNSCL